MNDPLHHPDRPVGLPVMDLTLSEHDQDFWDHLDSTTTLRGKVNDPSLFPPHDDETCMNLLPGRSTCNRAHDHKGRHMATLLSRKGVLHVCSAWPGTHVPTTADLEG